MNRLQYANKNHSKTGEIMSKSSTYPPPSTVVRLNICVQQARVDGTRRQTRAATSQRRTTSVANIRFPFTFVFRKERSVLWRLRSRATSGSSHQLSTLFKQSEHTHTPLPRTWPQRHGAYIHDQALGKRVRPARVVAGRAFRCIIWTPDDDDEHTHTEQHMF